MITLLCVIDGGPLDQIFPIDIDAGKLIGHLQRLVKECSSPSLDNVVPAQLSIYRISVPAGDAAELQHAIRHIDEEKDRLASWETVGEMFPSPASKHIHAVIKVPGNESHKRKFEEIGDDTMAQFMEVMRAQQEQIIYAVHALKAQFEDESSKTEVSISKIEKSRYDQVLSEGGYKRILFDLQVDVPLDPQVIPAFQWKQDADEPTQCREYLAWLELYFPLREGLQYYNGSDSPELLTTSNASPRIRLKGTTDVAVVEKTYVASNVPSGVRVAIELKKKAAKGHIMQAVMELLCATKKSNFTVVALLTDLREYFQFFWIHERSIFDWKLERRKAATVLRLLVSPPTPDSGSAALLKAFPGESSEKVHSLRTLLCASESSHKKVDGVQALLGGQGVELLDILPQEEVADMRDVFDVMSPAEITDWVQKASLRYFGRMGSP